MERRRFLKNTLTVTSAISLSTFPLITSCSDSQNENSRPLLNDFLSEDDLKEIIKEYLVQNEKFDKLNLDSKNTISNRIKDDFIEDNIIVCNGWVLSQTELKYLVQKTITKN